MMPTSTAVVLATTRAGAANLVHHLYLVLHDRMNIDIREAVIYACAFVRTP